jgi:hypothetical protein
MTRLTRKSIEAAIDDDTMPPEEKEKLVKSVKDLNELVRKAVQEEHKNKARHRKEKPGAVPVNTKSTRHLRLLASVEREGLSIGQWPAHYLRDESEEIEANRQAQALGRFARGLIPNILTACGEPGRCETNIAGLSICFARQLHARRPKVDAGEQFSTFFVWSFI